MLNHPVIKRYQEQIALLRSMGDDDILYQWLIDQGRRLQKNPLSEAKRTEANRVSRCQYQLFVDCEGGQFKAWSDGLIASGYAYLLIDIFNDLNPADIKTIKAMDIFNQLDIGSILSLNRSNGFYQMIDMLMARSSKST